MQLKHYEFTIENNAHDYFFFPNSLYGDIKKAVSYVKVNDDPPIYNLVFGDVDQRDNSIIDRSRTGNHDTDLVLATIANTVETFCDHHGKPFIFATGSTASRSRLYQINISKHLDLITLKYNICGIIDGVQYRYKKNTNFQSFLFQRK